MTEATVWPDCEICDLLPDIPPEYVIAENHDWNANVWPDQTFLGCTHFILRRHVSELDKLTPTEELSLKAIRDPLMHAVRSAFGPKTFNTLCLKDEAFHDDPDHTPPEAAHLHLQVVPRYGTRPMTFNGEAFADPNPGGYNHNMHHRHFVRPELLSAIAATIRVYLPPIIHEPTPRTL